MFLVWEDIKEANPKMIMTFVAALKDIQKTKKWSDKLLNNIQLNSIKDFNLNHFIIDSIIKQ